MENLPTFTLVVAAAIFDGDGRLLLQQCPAHKRNAGKWEFPGGKVEREENPQVALLREVREELGLQLDHKALTPAGFAEQQVPGGSIALVMLLYTCLSWDGKPEGREGQQWGWFTHHEAAALDLPPMDRALFGRFSAMCG